MPKVGRRQQRLLEVEVVIPIAKHKHAGQGVQGDKELYQVTLKHVAKLHVRVPLAGEGATLTKLACVLKLCGRDGAGLCNRMLLQTASLCCCQSLMQCFELAQL